MTKDKKPGVPLSASTARKFKEHNDKLANEATIRSYVDALNEILEARGELRNHAISPADERLLPEIAARFDKAGWCVAYGGCAISIWLD